MFYEHRILSFVSVQVEMMKIILTKKNNESIISNEGALRLPLTYDNQPNPTQPNPIPSIRLITALNELNMPKINLG